MADADSNNSTSQNAPGNQAGNAGGNQDALTKQLAEIQEGLGRMNAQIEAQANATAAMIAAQRTPAPKQEEENLYDPQALLRKAEQLFDTKNREVKNKDLTIYSLSQEYPEIQTDTKLRQAVLDAQKAQPLTLQDTAEGYKLAVLEATSKAGIIAKSQRKTVEDDPSYDSRRSSAKPKPRVKVSQATLEAAALMGRPVEDPEFLKRLEDAANRDTYGKYR